MTQGVPQTADFARIVDKDEATYILKVNSDGSINTVAGTSTVSTDVNVVKLGGTAISVGAGAVDAGTQRGTLASDDPAVVSLQLIDDTIGTKAAGTAATKALLGAGVYSVTAPAPTDGQQAAMQLDSSGHQQVAFLSRTGAQTIVPGSASAVTLLAANVGRQGGTLTNDSSAILYVLMATGTVSATVWSYQMNPGDALDIWAGYRGIITGIWASATGNARVTEWVA